MVNKKKVPLFVGNVDVTYLSKIGSRLQVGGAK